MPEFNTWFPTSRHGNPVINVMDFGAYADSVVRSLNGLGFTSLANAQAGIGGNGKAYPEATSLDDYADWCAITAAVKAAFSTGGVRHDGEGYKNRPLCFPAGRYLINKPVDIVDVSDSWIYGTGSYTHIYNENETPGQNTCFRINGLRYSRIENLAFGAKGTGSIAFDLNSPAGTVDGQPVQVLSHGNVWICCSFSAVGTDSVGCLMGGFNGQMGSEQTFIRCTADNNTWGWIVGNANALSYLFITCLGNLNAQSAIRINTGGGVTCINCAFSENGEGHGASGDGTVPVGGGADIDNFASSPITLINCRTESRFHVRNPVGYTLFMGCNQSARSSETILCQSDTGARIITTDCFQSRLEGEGEFTIDNPLGNFGAFFINTVTAGASNGAGGNLVKITHDDVDVVTMPGYETWQYWRDGDEVEMQQVKGTTFPTAPSVNGIWNIHKIDATNFELLGSTYVADTYIADIVGFPGKRGYMRPGPRYHLTSIPFARPPSIPMRKPGMHRVKDLTLMWIDSGTTYTNLGATTNLTFTLPIAGSSHGRDVRGTTYAFVVVAAHTITLIVPDIGYDPQERFIRPGAEGTQLVSTAVIGSRIEVQLVDGQGGAEAGAVGYRWVIVSETGTWTLSGTP